MYERMSYQERELQSLAQGLALLVILALACYGLWIAFGMKFVITACVLIVLLFVFVIWCALDSNRGLRFPQEDGQ